MQSALQILTGVALILAIVIGPIAWLRIIRAKTRDAYWKNIALFALPILFVFFLADISGLKSSPNIPAAPLTSPPSFAQLIEKMPQGQLFLLACIAVVWLGGGNLLFYFHNRRTGKKWWQALNPLEPAFKDFNGKEWGILIALFIVTFALMVAAID